MSCLINSALALDCMNAMGGLKTAYILGGEITSTTVVAGEITEPTAQGRRFGGNPSKPVKPFVRVRTASIFDQLAGKSEGVDFDSGGRGGRGRFGGRGGQRRESSPADAFLTSMDADKDNALSREEFVNGFEQWFQAWADGELLTEDELRTGIDANLTGDRR